MDIVDDKELFWIAREGLKAPLPKDWKPCKTQDTEEIYYFNFTTGASTWDHPCDGYYRNMYQENKKKLKENASSKTKGVKKDKRKDIKQLSTPISKVDMVAPSKLDLKPLVSLGIKAPIKKPSITEQPLAKMGPPGEDNIEPSGPPPILEIVKTKNHDKKRESKKKEEKRSLKTMKDVEDVISPRQLLRKGGGGEQSDQNNNNNNSSRATTPSSLNSSPNSSSVGSTSSSSLDSKKKDTNSNGFKSKKFGRGLASALTNQNGDVSIDEGKDEMMSKTMNQTMNQTSSAKATLLRQTRITTKTPSEE